MTPLRLSCKPTIALGLSLGFGLGLGFRPFTRLSALYPLNTLHFFPQQTLECLLVTRAFNANKWEGGMRALPGGDLKMYKLIRQT